MVPQTYEAWRKCIEYDCQLTLTPAFIEARLAVYKDEKNPETIRFIELYGQQHLKNILQWLEKTRNKYETQNGLD